MLILQSDNTDQLSFMAIVLIVVIGIFLIFRQINLWYFRINEQIQKLDKANEISETQIRHMRNQELLLQLLLQHHLGTESKIGLVSKSSGKVEYRTVNSLLNSTFINNIQDFDIVLVDK